MIDINLFVRSLILVFLISTSVYSQSANDSLSEQLYEIVQTEGIDAAINTYYSLKKENSELMDQAENQLNQLGYLLLNNDRVNDAVKIFKLNTNEHPESVNVWDSLGEGYLKMGNYKKAADYYQKVLNMLQDNTTLSVQQKNFIRNNAEIKLFEVKNFDPYSENTLHYVSFYGGVKAGKWDMENALNFKNREEVKIHYTGHNLYFSPVPTQIEESVTGSKPADISTGFIAGDYRRFIERGLIKDITGLWSEENWDYYFPEPFKRMATYQDRQYFIPMAYQWNPIWYRKDVLKELNLPVPKTWEELLELCKTLSEEGFIPFTISVQNWPPPVARWFTILNLRLNGPEFHNQVMRGAISFKDERIRNVFEHWRELFRIGAFGSNSSQNNYQDGIQELVTGKAVMYNLGEWLFESLDEEQAASLDFFRFPVINKEVRTAEIVHTYGAFIRVDSMNDYKSRKMLKWLASTPSQQSNIEYNNRIVANRKVDQSLYSDVQKRIIKEVNRAEVLVPLFEFNTDPEFANRALEIFQEYWSEPENIDRAVDKLEKTRTDVFDN